MTGAERVRLLLIEDDELHIELIQRAFEPWQSLFDLTVAHTLREARALLDDDAFRFDLLICDWRLPDGDGLELLDPSDPLPLLVMTGYGNERVAVEAIRAGALDYIVKSEAAFIDLPRVAQHALRQWRAIQTQYRTEQALREIEARYRLITENTSDLIAILDEQHRFRYVSPSAVNLLGRTPEELIGHDAFDDLHPDDMPNSAAYWQEIALRKRTTATFRYRHAGGSWRWFECDIKAVVQDGAPAAIVIARDITARRELEERLLQMQKMDALGRLSGGVAHDFNNLLAVIAGCTELARQSLPDDHPAMLELIEIQHATERASALTRQLLAFAHRQKFDPRPIDLNALIQDMHKLLRRLIREDITLHTRLAPDLWHVRADPGQIEQVLVNLAVNARDAMAVGGALTIATTNVVADEAFERRYPSLKAGEYVCLTVSDTGIGMDEETRRRAFEPFFTTKKPGEGTGLGLATCYGIVTRHGGAIDLASEPGCGTVVTIYLPRASVEGAQASETVDQSAGLDGSETIMLVEDDPAVRSLVARTLRAHGYTVLEASSDQEAIAHAAQDATIHLLLSDHVIPHTSGVALADRLTFLQPRMRVLFMTGYVVEPQQNAHRATDAPVIEKPFTPTELLHRVRALLDA
ncbi:response regulator [Roseiflexus castenholzii]|uniref:histidine kinase n=1 Tax=Roseiflexus castenholzii (strain DSM 13941 / HLO8) TaxID=383372 RepID=A7NMH4_ROSCS|nr:response regulator [Roseiflexus castenholzii]ABU58736.1 PAS/PAC sensor hybrid histidine kinase [Roseiflexus castenholzii DSM 13941]